MAWTACLVVVLSSGALLPAWATAIQLWGGDSLRSLGSFFPWLALAGMAIAWRRSGFQDAGTWWGMPIALAAIALSNIFSTRSVLTFFFHEPVRVLHPGMAVFLYAVGATLLLGGRPLLRTAIGPLLLLLLLNPVPTTFQLTVDLPLQILAANVARSFAHLIGLQPTGDQLRMMFAPRFGMMIVPGCDGLRGAVTLGYLALIYGYIRRLSVRKLVLVAVAGLLLGYLLNLARLCVLVCYYRAGLWFKDIQPYGTQVDYAIGVTLFLAGTVLVGWLAGFYLAPADELPPSPAPLPQPSNPAIGGLPLRLAVLAVAAIAFTIPESRAYAAHHQPRLTSPEVVKALPTSVGPYTLTNTWNELDGGGALMFVWAEYSHPDGSEPLSLGIYVGSEDHMVALSKRVQGVKAVWSGTLTMPRAQSPEMTLLASFYRDGETRTQDAETSCSRDRCELNGDLGATGALTIVIPHPSDVFLEPAARRLPIVLRRVWQDAPAGPRATDDELRDQFAESVKQFAWQLNLEPLVRLKP